MFRRTAAVVAAFVLPLVATNALARSVLVNVSIGATVPKYCRAGSSVATIDVAVSFRVDASGELVPAAPVSVPGVVCNEAALITLQSLGSGARSASAAGTSVRYVATTRFGAASVTLDTAAVTSSGTTSAPQIGSVSVVIAAMPPSAPLVPGTVFTDTLRISLTPR